MLDLSRVIGRADLLEQVFSASKVARRWKGTLTKKRGIASMLRNCRSVHFQLPSYRILYTSFEVSLWVVHVSAGQYNRLTFEQTGRHNSYCIGQAGLLDNLTNQPI